MTSWKEDILKELIQLRDLPESWDGDGAVKPSLSSFSEAFAALSILPDNGSLVPSYINVNAATGNFEMFFKTPNFHLDVSFLGDGSFAYYADNGIMKAKGVADFKTSLKVLDIKST